ncbi:hypothetical protein BDV10DRAFT_181346 [Aspergillus recurvatus]
MATDNDRKPNWYQTDVKSINSDARQLLESYSGLRAEDVVSHVLTLARCASSPLISHAIYERVVEYLLSNPEIGFLDAGCCVEQEIRFLAHEHIASRQLYGLDMDKAFIDLGYQLFRDKDRLEATSTCGNLTKDDDSKALTQTLGGKIDIVFASSLLHLWNSETQLKATTRLVAGDYPLTGFNDGTQHRHKLESLKGLWHDIGQVTHTEWKVDALLEIDDAVRQNMDASWGDLNMRVIWWSATRIE